jgi:uncharacterized BrkB/YihY/UPF0761 family membrane protein
MMNQVFRQASWERGRDVMLRSFSAVLDMDTSLRCASVAFFAFLSVFPALGIFVAHKFGSNRGAWRRI